MIVYTDVITKDEVLSDAFPLLDVVDSEGNVVEGLKMIESRTILKNDDYGFGGEDDAPAEAERVNNVVSNFSLNPAEGVDVATFKEVIGKQCQSAIAYHKSKGADKDVLAPMRARMQAAATYLAKNFKDLEFYYTESFNPDSFMFSMYVGENHTPNFFYMMDALIANRV